MVYLLRIIDRRLSYHFIISCNLRLPLNHGIRHRYIQKPSKVANLRHYYPDFVLRLKDKSHWLVETKGREDIDVIKKDEAAELWCEYATDLTKTNWQYLKVPQKEFEGRGA